MYNWRTKILLFVFLLGIKGEITIIPDAENVWIRESRAINLTCVFTGYHINDVTWTVNGSETNSELGAQVTKQRTWTYETSYLTVNYFKKDAEFTDTGNYSCSAGQITQTIEVKVTKGRLTIRPDFSRVTIMASKPIVLVCEFEGRDRLPVTWYKDQRDNFGFMTRAYVVKPSISSEKIAMSSEISEKFAKREDSGEYTCIAGPYSKTITVFVYDDACQNMLLKSVSNGNITASSFYEDTLYSDTPPRGRLDTVKEGDITRAQAGRGKILGGSWQAAVTDKRQWIQVAFNHISIVNKLITQGRSSTDCCSQHQWVAEYRLFFSKDGRHWEKYRNVKTGDMNVFEGNKDHDTKVTNELPIPVIARFIRIQPTSWNEKISLRFEVIGCTVPSALKMVYPFKRTHYVRTQHSFQVTCNFKGPETPNWRWLKDGRDLHLDETFMKVIETIYNNDGVTVQETLIKVQTQYKDSGNYTCRDETSGLQQGVEIRAAELDIVPEISKIWIVSGQPVNISCSYRGADTYQIKWLINDQSDSLSVFNVSHKVNKMADHVHQLSEISKVSTMEDNIDISCVVASLKKTISIRVIADKMESVNLNEGGTTVLNCNDIGHVNDVRHDVFWTKEHVPLTRLPEMTGRYELSSDTRSLTISHSKFSDAGRYECNILLEVESPSQYQVSIAVDVNVAPVVIMEGQTILDSGSTLHIFCRVSGYPLPNITWYKDGGQIPIKSARYHYQTYEGLRRGHLEVSDVTELDTGSYECKTVDDVFPAETKNLNVLVKELSRSGVLSITFGVLGTFAAIVLVICCAGFFIRVRRRRRKRKETRIALENMTPSRDRFTKPYVQLNTIERTTLEQEGESRFISRPFDLSTTEERINMTRELPEVPNIASRSATEIPTDDDTSSETYEKYERPMHAHTFPTERTHFIRR